MDACTLLKDIPQTGELDIGDATGRPMGLDGVMELVYERRWQHCLDHRDQKRRREAKLTDNTLRFVAEVFNDGLPVVGRYAHTARVKYDKHWDGRNRTKIPCLQSKNRKNWELVISTVEWTRRHMRFAGAHTGTSVQSDRWYGGL